MKNGILLSKFISLMHIALTIIPFAYFLTYLTNDTRYDIYFIITILLIRSHWMFFKGECIITYFEKLAAMPNYKLGSDMYNKPASTLMGFDTINRDLHPISFENFENLTSNLFIFVILLRNTKSENFNLILVLSLISINIQNCWFLIHKDYKNKLRRENKNLLEIPLSKTRLYL